MALSVIPTSGQTTSASEQHRHKLRKTAVERAARDGGGTIASIVTMDKFFFEMKKPRTIADLNYGLVTGSSSSLSSTALDTLPSSSGGVVLRSRFSVMGSEAGYSATSSFRSVSTASEREPFESHSCCSLASGK